MPNDIVIKVKNLSKFYNLYERPIDRLKEALHPFRKVYHKDFYALNNLSFDVHKGETIGIIGKNGAGKSTLLKILTGVLTPSAGEVNVNGKIAALLELGAGFNHEMTGIENIFMNGTIMGYNKEQMSSKIDDILSFADIGDFVYQPVKMYSSGMFARLAFAVAINVEPDILIVDETLSVGDLRFQIKCMNKMKQLMTGGTTVLFVSHDINAMRRFCPRSLWICNGKLQLDGETNRVADSYLEYLKCEEDMLPLNKISNLKKCNNKNGIAEIIEFNIFAENRKKISVFELNTPICVEVIYEVYDENILTPVLGIAIKSLDDDYVCGLNTLLDSVKIPWNKGKNKFCLKFTKGVLAVGGNYYFDVALFEETATIPIQYINRVSDFKIITQYIGEGRYIIPHEWHENE